MNAADPAAVADDLADVPYQGLANPDVRGAYDDLNNEALTTLALIDIRKKAGMTRRQAAEWMHRHSGMSVRRAERWVRRYERGELGGNAPVWLIHMYARAVGAAVVLTVVAPQVEVTR